MPASRTLNAQLIHNLEQVQKQQPTGIIFGQGSFEPLKLPGTFDYEQHRKQRDALAANWKDKKDKSKNMFSLDMKSLGNKPTRLWSVAEVLFWLSSVNLSVLQDIFDRNDIDGNALVEITNKEMTEMGIRVLAHRKLLARNINKLLEKNRSKIPPKAQHWSMIKPLSENKVNKPTSESVNLADGTFDETRARSDFQRAVEEWRRGREDETKTSSLACSGGGWTNPF